MGIAGYDSNAGEGSFAGLHALVRGRVCNPAKRFNASKRFLRALVCLIAGDCLFNCEMVSWIVRDLFGVAYGCMVVAICMVRADPSGVPLVF